MMKTKHLPPLGTQVSVFKPTKKEMVSTSIFSEILEGASIVFSFSFTILFGWS